MSYNEKAIKILADSLAQHKIAIKGIQESISKDKNLHSQEAIQLKAQLNKQLTEIDNSMRSYIKDMPIPKDGKDAKVDYESIFKFVTSEVLKIEPEKVNYDEINSKIDAEVSKIPTPKNGKSGKDGKAGVDGISPEINYAKVNKGVMSQFPKKEIIEDVKKSIPEPEVVVGIKEIKLEKDNLVIITTDGKKKKFPISFKAFQLFGDGGGDGVNLSVATSTRIVSTSEDISLSAISQNILANTTNGNINITLPDPTTCFFQERSYKIGITKIDISANKVIILPFGSESILLEEKQELEYAQDVLNFITDGTNWHIGS